MKSTSTSLLISIATFTALASYFWFVCDDAFISFRYADNLANGYGLVYNYTENPPVEGYSNFLWVILGASIIFLGQDITLLLPIFSILSGIFGLILLSKTLSSLQVAKLPQSLALISAALSPAYFIYATSGLETLPASVCLFACFVYLLIDKNFLKAAIFALILSLLRPEGILWVLVITGLSIFTEELLGKFKITFKFLIIVFSCYAIYFCWRWNYFQELLPLTVINKVGLTPLTLSQGINYFIVYCLTYLLPFVLILLSLLSLKKCLTNKLVATTMLMTLGLFIYPITTGGDFMTSGRFFVNTILFQSLLFGLLINFLSKTKIYHGCILLVATVSLTSMLAAFNLNLMPNSLLSKFHFRLNSPDYRTEAEQYHYMKYNSERWSILGKTLNRLTKPEDSIVAGAIGNLGFYSKRHIYDRFGLVEKRVGKLANTERKAKSPGHNKSVGPSFFLDQKPTIIKAYIMPSANQERIDNQLKSWENEYKNHYQGEHHSLNYIDSKGRKLSVLILRRINYSSKS